MEHLIASEKKRPSYGKTILIILIVLAVVGVLLLNLFTHVLPVVRYYGEGMEPTLTNGRILLVRKTDKVSEGDVIAFYYNNNVLVRRVVCTGGKQLTIEKDGSLYINGAAVDEPYLAERSIGLCNLDFPYYVTPNHVFVMGDNRAVAMDSRLEEIGVISRDRIIGKVLFVK